jgi:hypothetical protein
VRREAAEEDKFARSVAERSLEMMRAVLATGVAVTAAVSTSIGKR